MNISRGLALKSLGALGATAAAGLGLGLENSPLRNALGLDSTSSSGEIKIGAMAEKVGLNCPTNSNECSIDEGKFNVYHDSTKKLTNAKKSGGDGKIKFEENQEGYNQGLKFTIIDGDITFTNSNPHNTKLEKYEIYEAKEHEGLWYFSRKNTALEGRLKALGIPDDCKFSLENKEATCNLNAKQLQAVNFEGKNSIEIKDGTTAKLKIKEIEDSDGVYAFGDEKLKFTFEPSESIEINKETQGSIKLLKGTDPEFKIKEVGNKLTLEKVWSEDNLSVFASDSFTMTKSGNKWKVSARATINALEGDDLDLKVNGQVSSDDLEIIVEVDQEEYNQGFKFKFNKPVTLGKNEGSSWVEKINLGDNDFFEIKPKSLGEERRYFHKKIKA